MTCFQCEGFRSSISSATHFLRHQRLDDDPVWHCSYCGYQSLSGRDGLVHCLLQGHSLHQLCKSEWKSEEEANKKKSATGAKEDTQTFSNQVQRTVDESSDLFRQEDEEDRSIRRLKPCVPPEYTVDEDEISRIRISTFRPTPNDTRTKKKDAGVRTFESDILTDCSEQRLVEEQLKEEMTVTMPSSQLVTSIYPSLIDKEQSIYTSHASTPSPPSFPSTELLTTLPASPQPSPPTLPLSSSKETSTPTSYSIPSSVVETCVCKARRENCVGIAMENRESDEAPFVPRIQTFSIPKISWDKIGKWGGDSRQPGNYAYFTTKCVKQTKEDEECSVRVKVYLPTKPSPEEEVVEWVIELVSGDPVESHYDPSKPTYHRSYLTGAKRKALIAEISKTNLSQKEIVQKLCSKPEKNESWVYGKFSLAPTANAIKKLVREVKQDKGMMKEPSLEVEECDGDQGWETQI